jgi:hypothetical protein
LVASCLLGHNAGLMADGFVSPPSPRWYYRPWSVVLLLFFVLGPFGLPLLWKSPRFSRGLKIALTVAVVAYSALLVVTVLTAVHVAMEHMRLARAPITDGIR